MGHHGTQYRRLLLIDGGHAAPAHVWGCDRAGWVSQPQFDAHYRPFAYGSTAWNRYDLVKVAARNPPHVALWIETSKTDSLSYWGNSRLIATAAAPMSVTADVLLDAGHRMSVWVAVMPTALQWLGSTMSGFRPQS